MCCRKFEVQSIIGVPVSGKQNLSLLFKYKMFSKLTADNSTVVTKSAMVIHQLFGDPRRIG